MPASVQYTDLATPKLRTMIAQLQPPQRRRLMAVLGKELEIQLKAHFKLRDSEGNQDGWPRSHWWAREVRAKTALRSVTADKATVGIASKEFAFKLNGGTIKPGPGKKFLAIPLLPEAKGIMPRSNLIPGIFVVRAKGSSAAFLASKTGGHLRFYWTLVPRVTIKADPRALPPVAQLQTALEARAAAEIVRITQPAK